MQTDATPAGQWTLCAAVVTGPKGFVFRIPADTLPCGEAAAATQPFLHKELRETKGGVMAACSLLSKHKQRDATHADLDLHQIAHN